MLDKLIEQARSLSEHKHDYGPLQVAGDHIGFESHEDDLSVWLEDSVGKSPDRYYGLSDWALSQACQRLGPACWPGSQRSLPFPYLRECPPDLAVTHLEHWRNSISLDRRWFIRANHGECRAILTPKYSVVDVAETLEWVKTALDSNMGENGVKIYNPVVTSDVLHLRVIFKDVETPEGTYGLGAYFTTGEIGNRRLGVHSLIKRTSCDNSIIVSNEDFSWQHTHTGKRHILRQLFIDAIFHILDGSIQALQKMLALQDTQIQDYGEYMDNLCAKHGWTEKVRDKIMLGSEGYETVFGAVNGVSYAAQTIVDPDARANMEMVAGSWLK